MTGPRVLVIDDDTLQLELLQRVLGRDGFEVAVGATINDIRALAASFRPEVVLVDVNIPGASGGTGLSMAREVAPPGTRFYLFSSADDSKLRALSRDLKADGWLSKSMPVAELSKKLGDLVREKARPRA